MSLLVICKIFGVFVNTLTGDDKYLLRNVRTSASQLKCNYLKNKKLFITFFYTLFRIMKTCRFQFKCSYLKKKTFSQFFVPSLELNSNFKYFEKKMIVTANVFTKLQTVKDLIRPL